MKDIWDRSLFPAVPTPFTEDGKIHLPALEEYAQYMSQQNITGVALWVHTGRGLLISSEQCQQVFTIWNEHLKSNQYIICGIGSKYEEGMTEAEFLSRSQQMGERAKELGADAILVYPPVIYRDKNNCEEMVFQYHQKMAQLEMQMVLFYLYHAAGGISYSKNLLKKLFNIDEVKSIKMATLDSVCTYQDVAALVQSRFPDIDILTGEDRFFGYSLTRGAVGALVGLGAVNPNLQKEMIDVYFQKDHQRFVELIYKIDKLAEVIFIKPMEGYIERLLYLLSLQGIIPKEAVNDPFGPGISKQEKEDIRNLAARFDLI